MDNSSSFEIVRRFASVLASALFLFAATTDSRAQADNGTVSVFRFIPLKERAAIVAGTSRYDATSAIHAARDAVDGTGKTLLFPAGSYYVGEVMFAGSNYRIETAGVTFRQRPGLTGDKHLHPIVTFPPNANGIRMGDIKLIGNIATDRDEYSHGIAVLSAKNITIGDVYGTNIRGDVLYTYGRDSSPAELQLNLSAGVIRGNNIYRCVVALVGGDAAIAGIVRDGPIGYCDLDVEPNPGGAYQPVTARIGFVRGAIVQIGSADKLTINRAVEITSADLDGARLANSIPGYPGHTAANSTALQISRTDTVRIGTLKLRNYDGYPVGTFDQWHSIKIGTLDFDNCNTGETVFRAIVLQRSVAEDGVLAIDRVVGRLADPSRMVLRAVEGLLKVDVGRMEISGGARGQSLSGRIGGIRLKGSGLQ